MNSKKLQTVNDGKETWNLEYEEIFEKNGKKYYTMQDPYIDEYCGENAAYYAFAFDDRGNEYQLKWEIIDHDCDDQSNACHWQEFTVKEI